MRLRFPLTKMANFNAVFPLLAGHEGGISRNPNDNAAAVPAPGTNGAHTNKGVTWTTFVSHASKLHYEATPMLFLQMPDAIVKQIAKMTYWNPLKLDEINTNKKAYILFDFSFNSGPSNAIKVTQKALRIPVDGAAGPQFVKTINALSEDNFAEIASEARKGFITNSGRIANVLKPGLVARVDLVAKKKFALS